MSNTIEQYHCTTETEKCPWIVIGISGVTCGGKTSLANRLAAILDARVYHQDDYFYPDDSPHHVRVEGIEHNNYDILSALDMRRLYRDIRTSISGPATPERPYLIVEGFTALNYTPIRDMCRFRYYLVLEYGECCLRRALRLYDPPDVAGYFEVCVWPEHLRYRAQIEKDSSVKIIDGTIPNTLEIVLADLRSAGCAVPDDVGVASDNSATEIGLSQHRGSD